MILGSKTLISDRLVLRKIYESDAKEIYDGFVNQEEFLYYANKEKRTLQEEIDSLKGIENKYESNNYFNWIIITHHSAKRKNRLLSFEKQTPLLLHDSLLLSQNPECVF